MSESHSVSSKSDHRVTQEARSLKTYQGSRSSGQVFVTVNGHPLNPRLDLRNHSPSGFEWGYGGSGPAQLALALLADYLGDDAQTLILYQDFKWKLIAGLPHNGWTVTENQIKQALQNLQSETKGESV